MWEKEEGPARSFLFLSTHTRVRLQLWRERNLSPTAQSVVGLIYKIIFCDISHLYMLCPDGYAIKCLRTPALIQHVRPIKTNVTVTPNFFQQPAIMFDDLSGHNTHSPRSPKTIEKVTTVSNLNVNLLLLTKQIHAFCYRNNICIIIFQLYFSTHEVSIHKIKNYK